MIIQLIVFYYVEMVSTYVGGERGYADGSVSEARLCYPTAIAPDERDGSIYIADSGNFRIRQISNGIV